MEILKLIPPSLSYEKQIQSYKDEFIKHNENIDGSAGLAKASSISAWINSIKSNSNEATVAEGLVTASTYIIIREDDDYLIGMIDIRHHLNDFLFRAGGHIGYSVRHSERNKGYAKEMLRLALMECRDLNIKKVLVTCSKDNLASAKVILFHNGKFENSLLIDGKVQNRYWIDL